MFERHTELGFYNPYYFKENGEFIIRQNFQEIISEYQNDKKLDITSVTQFLNKGYLFGQRTMVRGVERTPWLAKPDTLNQDWTFSNVRNHFENLMSESEAASRFFDLLKNELLISIAGKKSIGILLTGGMDSRIIAGTLDFLIKNKYLSNVNVIAITWGDLNSRDVIYSQEIAKRLKWEWKHFSVTSDNMFDNLNLTSDLGCEFSPIHLHAMPQVRDMEGVDCVLAGSFGDSIGRAEYSGTNFTHIKGLSDNFKNPFKLLKRGLIKGSLLETQEDLDYYHRLFPQEKLYQNLDQDYQCHYMRRMLNPCMAVINQKIPLYQMFTSPEVYGFMWSLHPSIRNNNIYKFVMKSFSTPLDDIPWSRTGLIYDEATGISDKYKKSNHDYGSMVRNELFQEISNLVQSDAIKNLNMFNMRSIRSILKMISLSHINTSLVYEGKLIWIASLAKMINKYQILSDSCPRESKLIDLFNSEVAVPGEYILRKIKSII